MRHYVQAVCFTYLFTTDKSVSSTWPFIDASSESLDRLHYHMNSGILYRAFAGGTEADVPKKNTSNVDL